MDEFWWQARWAELRGQQSSMNDRASIASRRGTLSALRPSAYLPAGLGPSPGLKLAPERPPTDWLRPPPRFCLLRPSSCWVLRADGRRDARPVSNLWASPLP